MTPITTEERTFLSDYATRSFRNQADRDYVAARALWRTKLYHVFLWSALQAVEKYLKAILLYRCREVKSFGHDAAMAQRTIGNLKGPKFDIPDEATKFIQHLTDCGVNRYLDFGFRIVGDELLKLDWTVWHVRRYCCDFLLMPGDQKRYRQAESRRRLAKARAADPLRPTRYKLEGGLLERFLQQGPRQTRDALVWMNPCYGARTRRKLKNYPMAMMFENPTHVLRPKILPLLKTLVRLPTEVVEQLEAGSGA